MASQLHPPVVGSERPADLPDFRHPPLVEVVLGVQFTELAAYRTWHAGLLWDSTFRKRFPRCAEQPPLDPVFEIFGSRTPVQNLLRIQQVPGPVVPRLWFIAENESELIQFQSDRFLHNWRHCQSQDLSYPRYESIRDRFFEEISDLVKFLEENKIGSLELNQCEITYVNHIKLGKSENLDFRCIFTFFGLIQENHGSAEAYETLFEDGRFSLRFIISGRQSTEPQGRLHVLAEPAIELDGTPILRLTLTARGRPVSQTLQGTADFLDLGRETIVRTFTLITTEKMHQLWGRIK